MQEELHWAISDILPRLYWIIGEKLSLISRHLFYVSILVCFLLLWLNTDRNRLGKGRFICPSLREAGAGDKGRNLQEGTEAELIESCCLLACFLWFAQLPSSQSPGILQSLSRDVSTHSVLGLLQSISKQENVPQTYIPISQMGGIHQLWVFLPSYV